MLRNRYEVLEALGSGASGTVYAVRDTLIGAEVALKALWVEKGADQALLSTLRAELDVLASLSSPRLCRVHDLGRLPPGEAVDDIAGAPPGAAGYFITRELVRGVDLGRAAADRAGAAGEVCALLADAARGLDVLHRAGLRHGDFKPANAIVDRLGRVRLIDFGLVVAEGSRRRAGTFAYMAPEILDGRAADRRADLYALGVALFQLCTGALPTTARGAELARWHAGGPRPALGERAPGVDRVLARLWAAEPGDRYPTAAEAAAALDGCAAELGAATPAPDDELVIAPLARGAVRVLERRIDDRRRGAGPAVVEVVGDAGSGRSAVLRQVGWGAQLAGAEVVWGPAHAGGPLGAFGAALAQVAALTGEPSPIGAGAAVATPAARGAAVVAFLEAAARRFPLVVILDDLDDADDASRELVRYLAAAVAPSAPLAVLASRRPDGAAVGGAAQVELPPLPREQVAELVRRALGRGDERLAARVHEHTGGNLLHVVHSLERLAQRGLAAAAEAETLELPPRLAERGAATLRELADGERALGEVLAVLGRAADADLAAAVLAAPGEGASPGAAGATDASADALRRRGLVRADAAGRLSLARAALRDVLRGAIDDDRRAALHAAVAAALAERGGDAERDPEIVCHRLRAGDRAAARAPALAAVRALAAAGDQPAALALGRDALALLDAAKDGADERALRLELGELARLGGDAGAAEELLGALAAGDTAGATSVERARAQLTLGRALDEGGRPDAAEQLFTAVIAAGAERGAGAEADAIVAARELSRLHIKRGRFEAAREVAVAALERTGIDARLASHLLAARAFADGMLGDDDAAIRTLDEAIERARATGDDALAAAAYNFDAFLAFRRGDYRLAKRRYEGALAAAERIGDVVRAGTVRMNLASLAFHHGDYAGCHDNHQAAVRLLTAAGARTPATVARKNLGHALVELGAYEQARASLRAADALAEELGLPIHRAGIAALLGIAACRDGDWEQGLANVADALARFHDLGDVRRAADTELDLAELGLDRAATAGSGAAAGLDLADASLRRASSSSVVADDNARKARFLALRAELAARRGDPSRAGADLDELMRRLEALRAEGARHLEWNLLRSAGNAAFALGDTRLAGAHRAAARGILESMAAALADGFRDAFWRDPRRRALREAGRSDESSPARVPAGSLVSGSTWLDTSPESTVERLYRLLEIYRRMSTERDPDRLLAMAMDTAVELSGAERGFLLLARGDGQGMYTAIARNLPDADLAALESADELSSEQIRGTTHAFDPVASADAAAEVPYSRTIAEGVFRSGEPFVSDSAREDPRLGDARSVHALRVESVVCIPVRARGRIAGVLYVESRVGRAPFSDADARLLMAFGDQVAVLLDNARLLDENVARARELEEAHAEIEVLLAERTRLLEDRTEELARTRRDLDAVRRRFLGDRGAFGIIGRSAAMEGVFQLIERLAGADVPVLVLGESGTGKELVARALHEYGPRKHAPMMAVNCGALPSDLLESELFGHVRGAFTGADKDRRGLFEAADGGTLFLDEIGEASPKLQASLLRALQEGVIRRVGGLEDIAVDVRVIAATNRDLEAEVARGSFRADLFYRLHVVPVRVPPLRERAEDIPLLVEHFAAAAAERTGLAARRVSKKALRQLMDHSWPGNVRQLEHAITNAVVLAEGEVIEADDVAAPLGRIPARVVSVPVTPEARRERERKRILEALEVCAWNKSKAARMLEIPRRTFYRRLDEYGIR